MRMFHYLSNVVRGRYKHWNNTNNLVISALWERMERLESVPRVVFQEFLISSNIASEHLLGPDRGDNCLLNVKLQDVSLEQFQQIHILLLSGFVRLYESINPPLSSTLRTCYQRLTGQTLAVPPPSKTVAGASEPDLAGIATELWGQLVNITGSDQGSTTLEAYPFIALFGATAREAFSDLQDKLTA